MPWEQEKVGGKEVLVADVRLWLTGPLVIVLKVCMPVHRLFNQSIAVHWFCGLNVTAI